MSCSSIDPEAKVKKKKLRKRKLAKGQKIQVKWDNAGILHKAAVAERGNKGTFYTAEVLKRVGKKGKKRYVVRWVDDGSTAKLNLDNKNEKQFIPRDNWRQVA
eukprot:COSAG01_NODE_7923_length_2991_cov_9.959889_2_plen_103_part_00